MDAAMSNTCSSGAIPRISMPISSSGRILTPSLRFPRCLTALDCSAYSAVQGPRVVFFREHPPCQPLRGCTWIVKDRFWFMAKGNFGERLKRERELREVSMEELTKATRISACFVQALENEDWAKLPGGVFGHGFVRTIARYLGLNEEALLGEYDSARAEHLPPPSPKTEERIPSPPKWLPAAAALVVLLLVIGFFLTVRYVWHRYAAHRTEKESSAASLSAQPQSGSAAAGTTEQSSTSALLDLSVSTFAATHVRIIADNKLVFDAELPAWKNRHFSAHQQFEVTAGDSTAVLLQLNGKAMPPLGAPGASGTMVLSQKDLRP